MQRRGLAWVYPKLGFNLGLSFSLVAETQFKVVLGLNLNHGLRLYHRFNDRMHSRGLS